MASSDDDEQHATRKQRREEARAERRAAEQAARAGAARGRRLAQLGGAVTVVIVAIVVILIATGGGKPEVPPSTGPGAREQVAAVTRLLAGTTQSGNTLGSRDAPLTLQYFGDLECPVCRDFTLGALPAIIEKWVRSGRLKIEYRSLSTATGNAEQGGAEPAGTFENQQLAALAAGQQNRAWDYIELFYRDQGDEGSGYVTERFIQNVAQEVPGLELSRWTTARTDRGLEAQIAADARAADGNGFSSTPSFLIGRSGGRLQKYEYGSLTDPSGFEAAFEKALAS